MFLEYLFKRLLSMCPDLSLLSSCLYFSIVSGVGCGCFGPQLFETKCFKILVLLIALLHICSFVIFFPIFINDLVMLLWYNFYFLSLLQLRLVLLPVHRLESLFLIDISPSSACKDH